MGAKEARNAETQVQQKILWAKAAFFSCASLIGADRVWHILDNNSSTSKKQLREKKKKT